MSLPDRVHTPKWSGNLTRGVSSVERAQRVNSNNNIDNYTYYNTKNLSKTYGGNFLSNFNYINLTESLLNKTQNVIFPPKKTNLKNNSCCNILNFKRIIDIEKNDTINEYNDIPKLLDINKIICNNFNKNKKEKKN